MLNSISFITDSLIQKTKNKPLSNYCVIYLAYSLLSVDIAVIRTISVVIVQAGNIRDISRSDATQEVSNE